MCSLLAIRLRTGVGDHLAQVEARRARRVDCCRLNSYRMSLLRLLLGVALTLESIGCCSSPSSSAKLEVF